MGRKCPKREFPLWKPSCVALYRGAWAVSRVRSCFFLPIQPQWCPWRPGSGCRRANRRADINVSAAISIGLTRSVRRSCRSCAEPGAARRGRRGASSAPGAPHPLLPRRAPPHLLHRRSTRLCQQSHGRSTVRLIGERSERQGEQLWRRAGRRVGRGLLGAPGALRPPLRRPLHLLPPCAPSRSRTCSILL